MRKDMRIAFLSVALVIISSAILALLWLNGTLYFRLTKATVTLNGEVSKESKIYASSGGAYMVFLESERAQHPVYLLTENGTRLAVATGPIPSSYTKSIKTGLFVFCYDFPFAAAESPKYSTAKISTSNDEISFFLAPDNVTVKF